MNGLSPEERQRYGRHIIMPDVGLAGQEKLRSASVLIIGAGGLGSPVALYLAAAGVGRLGLVDFDTVDLTNLHRQVIHGTGDVGRDKLDSAEESIRDINPHVLVEKHRTRLTSENALDILTRYDVVADGTDNFPTRYLVNDACVLLGKPNAYGSIFQFDGQATVFNHLDGPCYRCLFPEPPPPGAVPSCAEGGVLGVLPGVIGLIQATETIKIILGAGEPLVGRLLLYDALAMRFTELKIARDPACPVCGDKPTLTKLIDYESFCGVQQSVPEIEPVDLKRLLDSGAPFLLLDVREPDEHGTCKIEGSRLIPLAELTNWLDEIDHSVEIVVHCHYGGRSAAACQQLIGAGFQRVRNLRGGIDAWSVEIDPSTPRY